MCFYWSNSFVSLMGRYRMDWNFLHSENWLLVNIYGNLPLLSTCLIVMLFLGTEGSARMLTSHNYLLSGCLVTALWASKDIWRNCPNLQELYVSEDSVTVQGQVCHLMVQTHARCV